MKTITSTVAFQDSQGNVTANGFLILQLSQPSEVTSGGGQIAPLELRITLDATGKIPAATQIWANDELTPTGTTYAASLKDSGNAQIAAFGAWSITGTSPIDVSQLIPTTTGASYPAPVLLNPAGDQEITAGNLIIDQSVIVKNGTAFRLTLGGTPTAARTVSLPDATDTLVARATTDTLTNKTVTSSSNSKTLLSNIGSSGALTGNAADQNIFSLSVPGNTLGSGRGIRATAFFSHSTGSAAVVYKISFGGTATSVMNAATAGTIVFIFTIMNNPASTGAQLLLFESGLAGAAIVAAATSAALSIDTTATQTLAVTFNVANTDQVIPISMVTELIH